MNTLINIAQRFIYIKDLSTVLNWKFIEHEFISCEYRKNVGNLISTNYNFFDKDLFIIDKSNIESEVRHYLNTSLGIAELYENIKMTESWANVTEPNHHHHEHLHPFSVVSGILFMDNNPDNLNLMMETTTPDLPFFLPKNKVMVSLKNLLPDLGYDPKKYNNLQYHLVLFLSNWHHYVEAVAQDRPARRTLSFNTMWSGFVGGKDNLSGMMFPK